MAKRQPIYMSKPAYNFFNHIFTSFSSTGQKVLQTCQSLTKLLPYCQSELRQTWASFQNTFKVWPWLLEELSVVATASIYSAPPWCADIVSSPRWSNNFAPACEESWHQGAKKHWDTWTRSIMMPCLMSLGSTGPPESQFDCLFKEYLGDFLHLSGLLGW